MISCDSQFLNRSGPENPNLSPKDCFRFLAGATQTFRLEYINKQKIAEEEIERRYFGHLILSGIRRLEQGIDLKTSLGKSTVWYIESRACL